MFEELWKKSTPWLVLLAEMFQSLCKFQFEAGSSCLAVAVLPRAVTVVHSSGSDQINLWSPSIRATLDLRHGPLGRSSASDRSSSLEARGGAMGCHGGNE